MSYSSLRGTTSVGFNQMRRYLKSDEKLNKNLSTYASFTRSLKMPSIVGPQANGRL